MDLDHFNRRLWSLKQTRSVFNVRWHPLTSSDTPLNVWRLTANNVIYINDLHIHLHTYYNYPLSIIFFVLLHFYTKLTSTISVTQIRKPPDVAQAHGEAETGEEELDGVVPLAPLPAHPRARVLLFLCACLRVHPTLGSGARQGARVGEPDTATADILAIKPICISQRRRITGP